MSFCGATFDDKIAGRKEAKKESLHSIMANGEKIRRSSVGCIKEGSAKAMERNL